MILSDYFPIHTSFSMSFYIHTIFACLSTHCKEGNAYSATALSHMVVPITDNAFERYRRSKEEIFNINIYLAWKTILENING
jgi:hypothetical protein